MSREWDLKIDRWEFIDMVAHTGVNMARTRSLW